ncbi:MAG: Ger(x)C family spore germination protein [Peptococcaceae bacterium]|nr:Ger(x)C family spore germination protein [Peptococcaceae bacterium]
MKAIMSARNRIIFIVIFFLLANSSGCVNRREVDKLGLLGVIAVDHVDNQTVVTMEVTKPRRLTGGGTAAKEPYVIVQTRGDSFFDAVRNATNKFDRKIFLSTCRIFIISETTAKKGIAEILDLWCRDHEGRESDYILIAKDTEASGILGISGGVDDVPSQYLTDLIRANSASSKSVAKRIYDFIEEYYSDGIQPTLGVAQIEKKAKPVEKKNSETLLEGTAVFKKDKMVGYLDGLETRALNFIKGKVKSGIIVTPSTEENKYDSVEIIKAKSKMDVSIQDKSPLLHVIITVNGMLGEDQSSEDISDLMVMKQLEKSAEEVVKKQVQNVIEKAQKEYGLDIFGFGLVVHRKYPDQWKKMKDNWDGTFSESNIQVEVKVNISRTGLFRLPTKTKMGK